MVVAYYLSKDSEISKYIKYLNLVFLRKKKKWPISPNISTGISLKNPLSIKL